MREKHATNTQTKNSPEEAQYAVWRRFSADKTVKLVSDFSLMCRRLSRLVKSNGLPNSHRKNRENS